MDNMDTNHFPDRLTLALVELQAAMRNTQWFEYDITTPAGLSVDVKMDVGYTWNEQAFVADYTFQFDPIILLDENGEERPYATWTLEPDEYISVVPVSDELQDGFNLFQLRGIADTFVPSWA